VRGSGSEGSEWREGEGRKKSGRGAKGGDQGAGRERWTKEEEVAGERGGKGGKKDEERERGEKGAKGVREEVRAPPHMVVQKAVRRLLRPKVLRRVRPQDVAHQALRRRLAEAVDLRAIAVSVWISIGRSGWPGRDGEKWGEREGMREGERTHSAQVVEGVKLGGEPAVNAQELLIEHGREGQRAERLGAGVVDALRVLVLAYTTRRECQRDKRRD
jgi:hypothetical protein